MTRVSLSFRMSVRILLCLIVCVGESAVSAVKLIEIAPGSDVSFSCPSRSGPARWEGRQFSNTIRLNLNSTDYLLIKDFQDRNQRQYDCNKQHIKLELKKASSNDQLVLFRASEGESVFLFCKDLLSPSIQATWSWRANHSDQYTPLRPDTAHFRDRLRVRNNNNDFSLTISNIQWDDSGRYECQRFHSSSLRSTVFDLVVVRVHTDPEQLTEGDSATLRCEVSHHLPDTRLYWINMETQESFLNPHELRNVTKSQRSWSCAVFTGSKLKALVPLTLNITQRYIATTTITTVTTTATSSTTRSHSDKSKLFTLIIVCTVLSFLLLVLLGAVCWRKKIEKRMESSTSAPESTTYASVNFGQKSERIESSTSASENITYADVNFRPKSERMESSTSASDSITYAAVNFKQKSETLADGAYTERSPISNNSTEEEKEVIYSSVHKSKTSN